MSDTDNVMPKPLPSAALSSADTGTMVRLARNGLLGRLQHLTVGRLRLEDPWGTTTFGERGGVDQGATGFDIALRITDPAAYLAMAARGTIGAAEAYMAGQLHVSDLTGMIRLFLQNRAVMESLEGGLARLGAPLMRLAHWYHRNTRQGSRRNIGAHYDLGNDFFSLFLDPTMMYSSAVFTRPDMGLDEAATTKLDLICQRLELRPEDHLLEIGTGWGGLALHAATHYGCRVTSTTISRNQFDHASRRVRVAGLEDRIQIVSQDYRDLRGQYDKLVSVEMIEAVGLKFLDTYFRQCSQLLKPAGRLLIQAITIADRHYAAAKGQVDFIQKYIFPGGALPSVGAMLDSVSRVTDLQLTGLQDIGLDYARTLNLWRERFLVRLLEVRRQGYSEEFIRMWEWYLCYCEGGFLERTISDVHVVFDKPQSRLVPAGYAGALPT
jgi:cyclopropane-fatty-acyl-phospholipid synthase